MSLNSSLPHAVILTLGTTNGAILIRLHTTDNNLHIFTTFVSRDVFDTRFLWTNIRLDVNNFDINHQTVTVAADSREAFAGLQSDIYFSRRGPTAEEEDPPAPPYQPTPAHSPEHHTTANQQAGPTDDSRTTVPLDNHQDNDQAEEPEVKREVDDEEQYWRAVDQLD